MIFETVDAEGLAQLSYLIGDADAGECIVVDPRRDVDVYLKLSRQHGVRITHVLETHIHADFLSGSRELAAHTGAPILAGTSDDYGFEHTALDDGDELQIGSLRLRALHTPGHSPEHVCYLIGGGAGSKQPWGVLTGDTLFAGSVGRPDLAAGRPAEELARALYRSIHEVLLPLGDEVLVYPGHGAGSPCGANIGERRVSTLGYERQRNDKLRIDSEQGFVEAVLDDLPEEPTYYARLKKENAEGPDVLGRLPHVQALGAARFSEVTGTDDAIIVDAREIEAFSGAHIGGALNIGLRASFPIWAGWLLEPDQRVLLVAERRQDVSVVRRHLFRIGLDGLAGYLRDGMRSWIEAGRPFVQRRDLSVHDLHERIRDGADALQVVDVRGDSEWEQGAIPTALHVHVPALRDGAGELDAERPVATYCGSGYRASMAASLLERLGFEQVHNVPGSMSAWQAAGYPIDDKAAKQTPRAKSRASQQTDDKRNSSWTNAYRSTTTSP